MTRPACACGDRLVRAVELRNRRCDNCAHEMALDAQRAVDQHNEARAEIVALEALVRKLARENLDLGRELTDARDRAGTAYNRGYMAGSRARERQAA